MKNFIMFLLLVFCLPAFANYPPTTSKGSGDSTGVTTFNFQFPNFAITHTGTTAALGVLSVAGGGTGQSTLTNHGVLVGAGTSGITQLAAASTNTVLTGQGASADPSFSATPTLTSLTLSGGGLTVDNGQLIKVGTSQYVSLTSNSGSGQGQVNIGGSLGRTYTLQTDGSNRSNGSGLVVYDNVGGTVATINQGKFQWNNTSAAAILSLDQSAGLTLNGGTVLNLAGSSSGTITVQGQAAAGTYNFNLPTTAGTSGFVLTSAGGGSSPMTWTSVITNPMTTGGDIIYGGASGVPARLANGTSGQVLQSAGGTSAPSWSTLPGNSTALKAVTVQKFLSTGTTTGYVFTISTSSTVSVGDTYTNNGNTYTVLAALSAQSGQVFFTSGASAPTASGTLTRATGSGTASISFTAATALATYTTPSSPAPLYLRVRMVGGGGGGSGSSTSAANATAGTSGGTTIFGANLVFATGGGGGTAPGAGSAPGASGAGSFNSPAIGFGAYGAPGMGANGAFVSSLPGPPGGSSFLGGAGPGGQTSSAGSSAQTNSGSGGGGAGGAASVGYGSSGGAGGYTDVIIPGPSGTYVYAVGAAGTHGNAGTSGFNGGDGAAGQIIVEEHYQ